MPVTLPTPNINLWGAASNRISRFGSRLYTQPSAPVGAHKVVELTPKPWDNPRHTPTPHPGNPDQIKIPMLIWGLGFKAPESYAYVEGAMVHAQLLSRQGAAGYRTYDRMDEAQIATVSDMAATIRGIRSRVWSIPLSLEVQKNVMALIIGLQQMITTETGKAAMLCDVFDNKLTPISGNLPDGLQRLPAAADRIIKAMTWVEYVHRIRINQEHNYFGIYGAMSTKVNPEFMAQLGVPAKELERADSIDKGLDLIVVASIARWVREVHEAVRLAPKPIVPTEWDYSAGSAIESLRNLVGIYGIHEIDDASLRKENERHLAAAIARLTAYKKGLQKRLAKSKGHP